MIGAPLLLGFSLGIGATLSPGPLLTLVITSSLERGFGAAWRVAIAPLITDVPIILASLLLLRLLSARLLSGLAVVGAGFVIYLGIETLARAGAASLVEERRATASWRDVWKGVLVNGLSPVPWIFIFTVLNPQLLLAWHKFGVAALAFPIAFYATLVGGKIAVAAVVATLRQRLQQAWYRRTLRLGGFVLLLTGIVLGIGGIRGVLQ